MLGWKRSIAELEEQADGERRRDGQSDRVVRENI